MILLLKPKGSVMNDIPKDFESGVQGPMPYLLNIPPEYVKVIVALNLPFILTRKELPRLVPFTPQHIGRLEAEENENFPAHFPVGKRRVGWMTHEVLAWLDKRRAEGRPVLAPKNRPSGKKSGAGKKKPTADKERE